LSLGAGDETARPDRTIWHGSGGMGVWRGAPQSAKIWRMGFIAHGHESFYDALFDGLRDYGYVEGQNLIVGRYAQGDAALFKEFAAEMVRLHVDVIVVVTTPAALAVKKRRQRFRSYIQTPSIP
jgi:hypothetical protein